MGVLISRVISTRSSAPPPLARNETLACPDRGASTAKRTSALPLASTSTLFFVAPFTVSPSAAISTSTRVLPASPFVVTTTPASIVSPARRKRGKAGRAMSGRLVTTRSSAKPKRSSSPVATAMTR